MIKSIAFTLAEDGKTPLIQIQISRTDLHFGRDEVHFKKTDRETLLFYADSIIRLLVQMGENG